MAWTSPRSASMTPDAERHKRPVPAVAAVAGARAGCSSDQSGKSRPPSLSCCAGVGLGARPPPPGDDLHQLRADSATSASPRHPQAPRASRSRAAGACSLAGLRASAIESESARRTINRCAGLERTRECRCCRRFRFGPGRIMRLPLWIRVEPPAPAVATFRDRPRPRPGSHPMDQLILTRSCPPKAPAGRPG